MIDPKLIDHNWDEEHYVKRGDPSKPTYYIIRRKWSAVGLFSNFIVFAGHIRYALSKGWLPVIDMQNYPNANLAPEKLGKENSWEYYFEQPLRIGLEEAYNGENVILCKEAVMIPPWNNMQYYDPKNVVMAEWRMLVKMGLLKIKPALMNEILEVRKKLFAPTDRVLGVSLRGSEYAHTSPKNHPIPPPPEHVIDVIIEKIRAWKCNKIFLATEDKNFVQFFKDTFGDGFGTFCVTTDREYIDYNPKLFATVTRINRENDHYLQGKEYLTQLVILSKCTSLIASRCSGTCGLMMLAENFENVHAFNLGLYGVRPVDWRKLMGK